MTRRTARSRSWGREGSRPAGSQAARARPQPPGPRHPNDRLGPPRQRVTAKRRVAAIEGSLPPEDIVLHVIAEAHQYASLEAYGRSLVDTPVEATPLSRIGKQTEDAVRAGMRGKPRDDIDKAVRRAVGDAVFRYILFLRMNTEAHELAGPTRRDACVRSVLVDGRNGRVQRGIRRGRRGADGVLAGLAVVAASLLATSLIEDDARGELERRYLGGQSALLRMPSKSGIASARSSTDCGRSPRHTSSGATRRPSVPIRSAGRSSTSGPPRGRSGLPTTPGSRRSSGLARTCGPRRSWSDG